MRKKIKLKKLKKVSFQFFLIHHIWSFFCLLMGGYEDASSLSVMPPRGVRVDIEGVGPPLMSVLHPRRRDSTNQTII